MIDTVLYLSPHFDDVVFSCPLNLIREPENGRQAVIATFFTEGDQSAAVRELYQTRDQENNDALSFTDAKGHSVGLIDAPFRDPGFTTFSQIVLSKTDGIPTILKQVRVELTKLIARYNPIEIIAPLGIGTHIDHLLVHEALTSLECETPPVRFYEDFPYASVEGALQLRLGQLQVVLPAQISRVKWATFENAFVSAKYVDRYLKPKDRGRVIEQLHQQWHHPPPVTRQISYDELHYRNPAETTRTTEAANAYLSQRDVFFDNNLRPASERLWIIEE